MSIPKASKVTSLGPRIPKPADVEPDLATRSSQAPSVSSSFIEVDRSKLTVFIDASLHRRFKAAAAAGGENMRDVVETLIEGWVDSAGKGGA